MTEPRYINHITLTSGHTRRSPRSKVGGEIIELLTPLFRDALTGEHVPIPGRPGYTMSGTAHGRCCMVTIWAQFSETARPTPEPVVTVGIASHSRCGAHLWRSLHDDFDLIPTKTDRSRVPEEPWCAAVLHPAAVVAGPDALYWIADLERCLAWTWIETRGTREDE